MRRARPVSLPPVVTEERTILLMRFFGNLTQPQIAERVGLSQMHGSRFLARTFETLRTQLLR